MPKTGQKVVTNGHADIADDPLRINGDKAPFPWFGGKSQAAPLVWRLLGDPPHYCEPFFGSGAVLLNRPHPCNRAYYSETVNDADGFLVNAWRAIQFHPDATAEWASWPVSEVCKTARQIAVIKWRTDKVLDLLAGSPDWCDPQMAGWWLWGVCCQIGAIGGPWTSDPKTGRIVKQPLDTAREPGVYRDLLHISDDGKGVNHASTREPGVSRKLPHISDDGRGVNRPQLREPGMFSDNAQTEYHPMTMPELRRWFAHLSARLRHVRILNGDWSRLVKAGAALNLSVRQGKGPVGIFLDPPYDSGERSSGLYADGCDDGAVAAKVREWCKRLDPADKRWRVVLAGYDTEHTELEALGWTVHEWFAKGHLKGGYGNVAKGRGTGDHQQRRERLWASPQCLEPKLTSLDEEWWVEMRKKVRL